MVYNYNGFLEMYLVMSSKYYTIPLYHHKSDNEYNYNNSSACLINQT